MMLKQMKAEQKLFSRDYQECETSRFQGCYFSINVKKDIVPLFLAVNHECFDERGVQIYWSRSHEFPSHQNSEGCYNIVHKGNKRDMEIKGKKKCSGAIVFAEEPKTQVIEFELKSFGCIYIYIGVYSVIPGVKVKMAYSVRKKDCEMTLNL